jgi:hypothetical protein
MPAFCQITKKNTDLVGHLGKRPYFCSLYEKRSPKGKSLTNNNKQQNNEKIFDRNAAFGVCRQHGVCPDGQTRQGKEERPHRQGAGRQKG